MASNSYVGGLDGQALTAFNVQKRRVNEAYGLGRAQNTFQRSSAKGEYTRGYGDLKQRFIEARRNTVALGAAEAAALAAVDTDLTDMEDPDPLPDIPELGLLP